MSLVATRLWKEDRLLFTGHLRVKTRRSHRFDSGTRNLWQINLLQNNRTGRIAWEKCWVLSYQSTALDYNISYRANNGLQFSSCIDVCVLLYFPFVECGFLCGVLLINSGCLIE